MGGTQHGVAVGVFADREQARRAVAQLLHAGFQEGQVGLLAHARPHATGQGGVTIINENRKVPEGVAVGAAAGAGIGALWAIGIATLGLPAIGPAIAGGVLASVLASAAGGVAAGGFVGALVGFGISEQEARHYETRFKAGNTILTVQAGDRYDEAVELLRRAGGSVTAQPAGMEAART